MKKKTPQKKSKKRKAKTISPFIIEQKWSHWTAAQRAIDREAEFQSDMGVRGIY